MLQAVFLRITTDSLSGFSKEVTATQGECAGERKETLKKLLMYEDIIGR